LLCLAFVAPAKASLLRQSCATRRTHTLEWQLQLTCQMLMHIVLMRECLLCSGPAHQDEQTYTVCFVTACRGLQHLLQVILCMVCTANAVHCCSHYCWCVYDFVQVSAFAAATAFDLEMDLQFSVLSNDEAVSDDHCACTVGMAPDTAASLLWPATSSNIERSARLLATRATHCAPLHACAGSILAQHCRRLL